MRPVALASVRADLRRPDAVALARRAAGRRGRARHHAAVAAVPAAVAVAGVIVLAFIAIGGAAASATSQQVQVALDTGSRSIGYSAGGVDPRFASGSGRPRSSPTIPVRGRREQLLADRPALRPCSARAAAPRSSTRTTSRSRSSAELGLARLRRRRLVRRGAQRTLLKRVPARAAASRAGCRWRWPPRSSRSRSRGWSTTRCARP